MLPIIREDFHRRDAERRRREEINSDEEDEKDI
jgi:hypothetical protein